MILFGLQSFRETMGGSATGGLRTFHEFMRGLHCYTQLMMLSSLTSENPKPQSSSEGLLVILRSLGLGGICLGYT